MFIFVNIINELVKTEINKHNLVNLKKQSCFINFSLEQKINMTQE